MSRTYQPGQLRVTGQGDIFLAGHDVGIEVYQENGTWLRLNNVTAMDIRLRPSEPVTALTEMLVSEIDLSGIEQGEPDAPPTFWGRIRNWFLDIRLTVAE